jgi:hypothetical protein
MGAEAVIGDWRSENAHRAAALAELRNRRYTHAFTPDGDEVFEPGLRDFLVDCALNDTADIFRCTFETYWKTVAHVVRPRERIRPIVFLNIMRSAHLNLRDYTGDRLLVLEAAHGLVHHLSYVGTNQRIRRKLETFSHSHEIVEDWFETIWKGWDSNPGLKNLHPTHPGAFGWIENVPANALLESI